MRDRVPSWFVKCKVCGIYYHHPKYVQCRVCYEKEMQKMRRGMYKEREQSMREPKSGSGMIVLVGILLIGLIFVYQNPNVWEDIVVERDSIESKESITGSENSLENLILTKINYERTSRGLNSLVENPLLSTVARLHSEDMLKRNFYNHVNPEGQNPTDRALLAGYYGGVGENIFKYGVIGAFFGPVPIPRVLWFNDDAVASALVNGWMSSPGHKANILKPSYKIIGIGNAWGFGWDNWYLYSTTDFGFG